MNLNLNLKEILECGSNVSITLNAKDLQEAINYTISSTRKELEQLITDDKKDAYLSPKQVSEMLDVNLSTLFLWSKCGYLIPLEIGGKRRYRKSIIKDMLKHEKKE